MPQAEIISFDRCTGCGPVKKATAMEPLGTGHGEQLSQSAVVETLRFVAWQNSEENVVGQRRLSAQSSSTDTIGSKVSSHQNL